MARIVLSDDRCVAALAQAQAMRNMGEMHAGHETGEGAREVVCLRKRTALEAFGNYLNIDAVGRRRHDPRRSTWAVIQR